MIITTQQMPIQGSKGGKGGGGGSGATEADDSLRSDAYAGFIDLLGEGEWEGVVGGEKGIYINDSRYQNDDGTYNYTAERVEFRNGTQSQDPLSDFFANAENIVSVGTEVRIDTGAVIRTVSDSDVDKARIIVTVPQLTTTNTKNGNVEGGEVQFAIDLQSANGGFVTKITDTIKGVKKGSYQRQYEIDLTGLQKPVDMRVRRITPDATSSYVANKLVWDTYTEIISARLNYPNSVLVAMRIAAAQFQSIPSRSYHVKMLRIKVPVNYDPTTRLYTGTWDGTFKIAWSNNPAWCLYDILTADRYGLGEFIDASQVDKWALYSIGQYCDGLVDDGFGGQEPRFTCNMFLADRADAYKVVQDMASCFRGMTYWQAGQIAVVQDAPASASRLFTNANIINGQFTYQGSSKNTRYTAVAVAWNDPADMYKQKVEYVEDADGLATYGFKEAPGGISAFACTSRGQALRMGKWYLLNNLLETETVTFRIATEGAVLRPAEIIKVLDNKRAGKQASGRMGVVTTTTITTDRDVTLEDGVEYTLHCAMPDLSVSSRIITGKTGRVLTVASAFTDGDDNVTAPQAQGIWMLQSNTLVPQEYRVVGVAEDGPEFEVTALKCTTSKYAALEDGLTIEPAPITTLNVTPDQPANPTASESLYAEQSQVKVVLNIDWNPVPVAVGYEVTLTDPNGTVFALPQTANSNLDFRDAIPGLYQFLVRAVGANGKKSTSASGQYTVIGKLIPPSDVQNFTMFPTSNNLATFVWDATVDLDVSIGGFVRIRHSPLTDGLADFSTAIDIGNAIAGSATEATLPLITGTYFAKFADSSGKVSDNAAEIITTAPNVLNTNVIDTLMDSPVFTGTMVNCGIDSGLGGLSLSGAATVDEWPMVDDMETVDYEGGTCPEGSFTSAETVDLGGVYDVKLTSILKILTADIGVTVDARTDLIDSWPDIDGSSSTAGNAWLEVRTTNDDPAGTPVWDQWRRFHAGDYRFRGLQRRVQLRSTNTTTTVVVQECGITLDLLDRTEVNSNIVSGAAPYDVTYDYPFWTVPPTPGITMQNGATGDYFTIDNETAGGFRITFYNSAGVVISRTFAYNVTGQGKRQ